MVISGGACQIAADKIADKLRVAAARMMEIDPAQLTLRDGMAVGEGTNRSLRIAEVARALHHRSSDFDMLSPGLRETAHYDPEGTFSNAAHLCEVEVDPETGGVAILRYLVVEDAGLLINPMIVDGQITGGVAQGIASALFEELAYDDYGTLLTTSLADYLPPTSMEVPQIEILHMETISPASVTKAKGLGEGGTIGAPAAVLGAVNDALAPFAVTIDTMPATPDRIRAALRAAGPAAAE
jgi:carbon-monoxide dehydrogenase large subunit